MRRVKKSANLPPPSSLCSSSSSLSPYFISILTGSPTTNGIRRSFLRLSSSSSSSSSHPDVCQPEEPAAWTALCSPDRVRAERDQVAGFGRCSLSQRRCWF
ncbi:hypothetical protein XENOCAPTIV_027879 [Xenoophorus captivus]|uniref:Uncharacterized protein n=1 Tax=Xenoophorus captivus TaxID=1517983 RepID=A0ABV0RXE3_9TELE